MRLILIVCLICLGHLSSIAQGREEIPFNNEWKFSYVYTSSKNYSDTIVNVPHTWNANDLTFQRTSAVYVKKFKVKPEWKNKRVFIYFEGVNTVADVFVNKKYVGSHKGGYTAFSFEITDYIYPDGENSIRVMASNSYRLDVLPANGDFNTFGGIHRPVKLIVTEKNCISPLDYASSGVYIQAHNVNQKRADVLIKSLFSIKRKTQNLVVKTTITNQDNKVVFQDKRDLIDSISMLSFSIKDPILWNGKKEAYLYTANIELLENDKTIDNVSQNFGLRYFDVDAEKGFFLNGEAYSLHGFGYHSDIFPHASAYTLDDYNKDFKLFEEIGLTSLRLAHYPHAKNVYDWADKQGVVIWTEIPLIGFGGKVGDGYVNSPELKANIRQQLLEMVRQNYNHPSVFFWGLQNELTVSFDNPKAYIAEMNKMVKNEDPYRKTVLATHIDNSPFENSSDLIAWNKYYGWYSEDVSYVGPWFDKKHSQIPERPIGISEYGAGASIKHHSSELKKPITTDAFHPEEWQTYFHKEYWKQLVQRDYIWCKYVWTFADFSSHIRDEGDAQGINDKGLVTYDRKVKKDAFYFYKANWSKDAMVYISEKRNNVRSQNTYIEVFSNCNKVVLWINDVKIGEKSPDVNKIIRWNDVKLKRGTNKIKVVSLDNQQTDFCEFIVN